MLNYNDIYKEISEIIGLEATLKIYLRFKGQQVSFPVRLYSPRICLLYTLSNIYEREVEISLLDIDKTKILCYNSFTRKYSLWRK